MQLACDTGFPLFPRHVLFKADILKAELEQSISPRTPHLWFTDEYFRGMSEKTEKLRRLSRLSHPAHVLQGSYVLRAALT